MSDLCPAAGGAVQEARQAERRGQHPPLAPHLCVIPAHSPLGRVWAWHPNTTLYSLQGHHQVTCVPSLSWSSSPQAPGWSEWAAVETSQAGSEGSRCLI